MDRISLLKNKIQTYQKKASVPPLFGRYASFYKKENEITNS